MEGRHKQFLALVKIGISIVLLYFIFTRLPFKDVLGVIGRASYPYMLLALLLFVLSKILSALRLNLFFHQLEAPLTTLSNLKLYLLGMFYNLFLPGGIGGDAYKGYLIQKRFKPGTKRVVSALLLDRLSGLLVLFVLGCCLGYYISPSPWGTWGWVLPIVALLGLLVFWWINQSYFKNLYPVFWPAVLYSLGVQLVQLACIWCILMAFGIQMHQLAYLFIFLVSSIVAVLPITIGGIGSREIVFLYGALWLGLQEDTSVTISLIFFAITALVSLVGGWYHLKKIDLEVV